MLEKPTVIIKKYMNRKLYNTRDSYYISLADLITMVEANTPIKVILNRTQEDITAPTLFDAWASQKRNDDLNLDYVLNLIKGGK